LASIDIDKVLMFRNCGVVHLHMHNTSLRFDMDQFAEMITVASKKLSSKLKPDTKKTPGLDPMH